MKDNTRIKILVVDDDEVTRNLLREVLVQEGYSIKLAASGEEALKRIGEEVFAMVLSDIRMLELDGMAVLRATKKKAASTIVILMTGFGSMEGAIDAIQHGAFDYVSKPFKIDDLRSLVLRGVKQWELLQQANELDSKNRKTLPVIESAERGLIGKSPKIVEVYKTLARAAMATSSVLLLGETGTGKERVARAIHENSMRRGKAFVVVDCGALSENLLENELFKDAAGGTLFLDEVGALPQGLQVKLLRVLQDQDIRPHGVDFRVVAATHQDLEGFVKSGRFRDDLYYRLKVISIEIPPLRERLEDLPELVGHFLAVFSKKNRKPVSHVSDDALALLRSYAWPGNVRELEHVIERAVALTNSTVLFPEDFPSEIVKTQVPVAGPLSSLEDIERAHILKVLQDVNYNKSRASEVLGIDRATLYRKAQRYGIELRGK
ncbi:sigma-54 dependent transcriptional regulator [Bdellovibrionota bacterium FG-2]